MKNVSSNFRNELNNGNRNYIKSVDIKLKNGTILTIDNSKLWSNGLKIENAVSNTNSFDISSVIIGQLTLTILNINDEFSGYDFTDCIASNVKVSLQLEDGSIESLSYGTFYLNEATYSSEVITLTFYDCLYKFDKSYSKSKLQYPATLGQIVRDACDVCDVTLGTATFDEDDYVVQERPSDEALTFRQILLWVGQISVNYFYADEEGRLAIGWYHTDENKIDHSGIEETIFQDTLGNEILDTGGNQIVTNIETGLTHFTSFNTQLDDVVITGIRILHEIEGKNGQETVAYQSGKDGYVLSISGNKLIQGDEGNNIASMIAAKIVGVRFRAFTASCLSDPTIECGDSLILVDRKGKRYKSIVTNNIFQPGTFQNISCGAEPPARNSSTRYSQLTQVYVDYRKEIEKERTDREKALEELKDRVDSSSGVFTTVEEMPDKSKKYYLHDKPQLSESQIIWTMTAEAWTVSTDGGKTVNAGMTVDGDTIVRILTAVGVNADWIKSGAISIEDSNENETFFADTETGQVRIVAESFSLKGKTIDKIANEEVQDFVDDVYLPFVDEINSSIDQKAESWYQPDDPSTGWTGTESIALLDTNGESIFDLTGKEIITLWESEKHKHEGDLWKDSSNNIEYIYQGGEWIELPLPDFVFDTIDGKATVFVSQPVPPYSVGDLWVQGSTGDILKCKRDRESGSYVSSDWDKASKYTDDSAVDNLDEELDQTEIFNRLTNNGAAQGIYLQAGQLYLNGQYMEFNGAKIGGWTIQDNKLMCYTDDFNIRIQAPKVYGNSGDETEIITVRDINHNTWPFILRSDGTLILGDGFNYLPQGFSDEPNSMFRVGGWQIKKTYDYLGYAEITYWDTPGSQENGICAHGPWVIWGGWNGEAPADVANYRFVVTDQGVCKAMSWVTGSRVEWKENIVPYYKNALQEVLNSDVYFYDLKDQSKSVWKEGRHIGFVIGDGYNVSQDILDGGGGAIDMYSALAIAYRAIQEQQEEIEELKSRIGEAI